MSTGIIVLAHGSRIEPANEAIRAVAGELARAGGVSKTVAFDYVEAAFLELGQPDLAGAVSQLAGRGVRRIVVVPYFLSLGLHVERDLPQLVESIARVYNGLDIQVTPPLDGHPALIGILLDRVAGSAPTNA